MKLRGKWEILFLIAGVIVAICVAGYLNARGLDRTLPQRMGIAFAGFAAWMVFRGTWRAIRAHREYVRKYSGQCAACGYDLRESLERCPECGEPIAAVYAPNREAQCPPHPVAYAIVATIIAVVGAVIVMSHTAAQQSGH